ncbi:MULTISPECIES: acetamidase/formamidase family protein [unclassified Streptomyces]|uniref:acetamidase/formamidase family protein n=1 Tax=unclassified Streptomyces TaxID=2593676 RepID=UPI00069140AC|nr:MULTISPECIES: acetamidase/formamidase family protein [unclassified Streptomyces]
MTRESLCPAPAASPGPGHRVHDLPAGPDTVRVGVIDPAAPPVLTIDPGDEVTLSTWGHWGDKVTPDTVMEDFPALRAAFPEALGPHSLTGPIHVRGARPGDTLAVDVLALTPAAHGFNLVVAHPRGRGVLRDRFPSGTIRHFALDRESMTTTLGGRVRVPLKPFLGIMGVAPAEDGPRSTVEPGCFGGNMDLSVLVVGSRLRLPVFRDGAGFYCGDGHAVQGDGEVNQTAIETGMDHVRLRFTVERGPRRLRTPRAETGTHFVSTGFGRSLEEAARDAVDDLVDWLIEEGLDPEEAYSLCSIAADVRVTQMVNGVVGVHAVIEKLTRRPGPAPRPSRNNT